jgi:8-oxo-dGTP diphosphatase
MKRGRLSGKFVVAAGPVIIEKGKVLLVKHDDKFWKFPGGAMEKGESPEQCVIREAKEELGIKVKLIRPVKPMVLWKRDETVLLIHYLAKRTGKIKPAKFIDEWAWINAKKLPKDVGPNIRPVLEELKK